MGIRSKATQVNGWRNNDVCLRRSILSDTAPTNKRSTDEAEFTNMADAGKAALHIQWILEEL